MNHLSHLNGTGGNRTAAGKRILLDCRWLGTGGAGRATELLLRGLGKLEPPERWILWGPEAVRDFVWEGAEHQVCITTPTSMWGQRELLHVPPHDVAVYMHQIRPLRPGVSITLIHDTIPLRYGGTAPARLTKRTFFLAVVALSSRILTVSEFSKRCIERDLCVPASKIGVVGYPVDAKMVQRVNALRDKLPKRNVAIYVGRFARHKNLPRLLVAFTRTKFHREGGQLSLVGGTAREVRELQEFLTRHNLDQVSARGTCSQDDLEKLYATSQMLIMPSLEEGFGLPVWEAIACGLPVCVSDGGALPEIAKGFAEPFPAQSIAAMAAAIDNSVARPVRASDAFIRARPPTSFAADFLHMVEGLG